jgi:hypothetical protein
MAGSLTMPVSVVPIRLRASFLGFVLVVSVVTGLVFMHVLAMALSERQVHPGGRLAMVEMVDMGDSADSVGDSDDAFGGGGGHTGDVCVSSTTKFLNLLPLATRSVSSASWPGPVGVTLPEAPGSNGDLFSLCVLRR